MVIHLFTIMKRFPRWHAIGVAALTFVMLSVAMWPAPSQSVIVELPPQVVIPVPSAEATPEEPEFTRVAEEVQPGDTLSTVFERANAGVRVLYRMLAIEEISEPLERIYPGQSFEFEFDDNNLLRGITFSESILVKHHISLTDDGFDIEKIVREPEIHTRFAEATIDSSLYLSAKQAGLSDNMIMQMATLYGWDIDFALDIRAGDTFSLIYQEEYLDLFLIHISEPTRRRGISYAVFCLKKKIILIIRRPLRSTRKESSAASDVYKRQPVARAMAAMATSLSFNTVAVFARFMRT